MEWVQCNVPIDKELESIRGSPSFKTSRARCSIYLALQLLGSAFLGVVCPEEVVLQEIVVGKKGGARLALAPHR